MISFAKDRSSVMNVAALVHCKAAISEVTKDCSLIEDEN